MKRLAGGKAAIHGREKDLLVIKFSGLQPGCEKVLVAVNQLPDCIRIGPVGMSLPVSGSIVTAKLLALIPAVFM